MATPETQSASPPRKRRWYQFSLRTLLIVMLLASVGLSWFAVKMQQARRQREAVAAIRAAGGTAVYGLHESDQEPPTWLRDLGNWLGEEDLYAKVVHVEFPTATDGDLTHLERLSHIVELNLKGSQVSDAGSRHFVGLANLETLHLGSTEITDASLPHLAELHQLEWLNLSGTKITVQGLLQFGGLKQLRCLILRDMNIADEDVKELQEAFPKCKIIIKPDAVRP